MRVYILQCLRYECASISQKSAPAPLVGKAWTPLFTCPSRNTTSAPMQYTEATFLTYHRKVSLNSPAWDSEQPSLVAGRSLGIWSPGSYLLSSHWLETCYPSTSQQSPRAHIRPHEAAISFSPAQSFPSPTHFREARTVGITRTHAHNVAAGSRWPPGKGLTPRSPSRTRDSLSHLSLCSCANVFI